MRVAASLLALTLVAAAPPGSKTPPVQKTGIPKASPDSTAPVAQKPVWEVATVAPDAVEIPRSIYIVKPGDTLSAVVRSTGAGADAIARENHLAPPFTVRPGQKLRIPAGRYHNVGKGQSGIAIARAYGVDWARIVALNHLEEPFILRAGERLLIPSNSEVARMTLEQRAAAFRIDLDDLVTGSEPALGEKAKPAAPSPSPARQLPPTTPVAEPITDFGGRFAWPLQGKIVRPYGPMSNGGRNDGVNIAASRGTIVAAAADGVVAWAGRHPTYGNVILLRHGSGWVTIYGHADKLLVTRGQSIRRGQPIARVGMTGSSADQPQLFFEILQGRKPVSPMGLLPRGIGAAQQESTDGLENSD
ncbi:MAG TPA: M23 family metallopeptidase [Sphingomonas sp.]|nr:M23 family metallopeptidase [Sphingomonas sp.]